jgi:hypothetical protein
VASSRNRSTVRPHGMRRTINFEFRMIARLPGIRRSASGQIVSHVGCMRPAVFFFTNNDAEPSERIT